MATKVSSLVKLCSRSLLQTPLRNANNMQIVPKRTAASNSLTIPGPIPPEPAKKRFSTPLVMLCMFTGIYVGQYSAKRFAAFMEETELFVPEDDDD